ncbi:HpsJ-like protein, cyanoexosortase A-associated [Roseofilum capinflatum]|uniref:HpsJ family protein n=1 Tax=Roseofilum capinflatum BLCC-M114 TaxID=3022440 RepID=A0ABT7BB12_9CYAN|nr:HpsJ family protein [Roseofilum capinflatum]MDJ1176326.1 HpsJ family protein [Roseofilum capinflatum BLCC-M114]
MLEQQPKPDPPTETVSPPWFHDPPHPKDSGLFLSEAVFNRTLLLLPLVGYTLLGLTVIHTVILFIPFQPLNAVWVLETMGHLVEGCWFPLLGLACILYGRWGYVDRWELRLWRFLSRMTLWVGLGYLLMVPVGIRQTWQIDGMNQIQLQAQMAEYNQVFVQAQERLEQSQSLEDLNELRVWMFPDRLLPIPDNAQELKEQLQQELIQTQAQWEEQLESQGRGRRLTLIKQSVKWNLGAILAGVAFLWFWNKTRWSRHVRLR